MESESAREEIRLRVRLADYSSRADVGAFSPLRSFILNKGRGTSRAFYDVIRFASCALNCPFQKYYRDTNVKVEDV